MMPRRSAVPIAALLAVLLLAVLLLAACGEEKKAAPAASVAPPPEVRISPEAPTVEDCPQALVSGSAGGDYLWLRNGRPMEETGTDFCDIRLIKGDLLSVRVRGEGGVGEASTRVRNSLPEIVRVSTSPEEIFAGVDIEVNAETKDADGDFVDLRYRWAINGEVSFFDEGPVLPGDRFRRGDRISLAVTPFDDEEEGTAFEGVELSVRNAPPRFVSTPPASFKTALYRYEARAEDPDGDDLTYFLEEAPAGMLVDPATGEISWEIGADDAGEHRVRIEVRDEEGLSVFQEYRLNLSFPE